MSKSTQQAIPELASKLGRVSLIGAGPGEPKLITLRGHELLGQADVVLYDGLVNSEILSWAKPGATLLCVGKHGHGGMWTQKEIDDRTVQFANTGKHVVRLKGGDTAIFARTSEEVDRLMAEGIPYEIVPGVTAGLAATAYAGIPLTHRDWASAVALVTGQLQPSDGSSDSDDGIDWPALAVFPGTLVLYMGVTTAGYWSQQLIQGGKSPHTPVALVRRVSWPEQEIIRCELGNVAETIQSRQGFRPPVISIIGDVVNMPQTMNWFSQRPLFGKRFLVAASERTGGKLRRQLADLGAYVALQPVLNTIARDDQEPIDSILQRLDSYRWIVFSSPFGVECFFKRLQSLGLDARKLSPCKIAAVGSSTSEAISQHHLIPDLVPDLPGIENLVPLLKEQIESSPGEISSQRILLVRPKEGLEIAQEVLTEIGVPCDALHLYRQQLVEQWPEPLLVQLQKNWFDAIVVTSLHIAEHTVALTSPHHESVNWISISPRVTQRLQELGCRSIKTAKRADIAGLIDCVREVKHLPE